MAKIIIEPFMYRAFMLLIYVVYWSTLLYNMYITLFNYYLFAGRCITCCCLALRSAHNRPAGKTRCCCCCSVLHRPFSNAGLHFLFNFPVEFEFDLPSRVRVFKVWMAWFVDFQMKPDLNSLGDMAIFK